jgi:membrane associated rhomboid family serine protease
VLGIIAVTTAVFVAQVAVASGHPAAFSDPVFRAMAGWVPDIGRGQWWRVPTSQLLHLSWGHLVDNMGLLYLFGPLVEAFYKRAAFLVVYLTSGMAGVLTTIGIAHFLLYGGASVAVFGIHGAVLMIAGRRVREPWMWTYLVGAIVSVAIEWQPYTAANFHTNEVHLYRLLAGAALPWALSWPPRPRSRHALGALSLSAS